MLPLPQGERERRNACAMRTLRGLQGSFGPVTVGAGTLVKVEIREVVP